MSNPCACGCGQTTKTRQGKYVSGHSNRSSKTLRGFDRKTRHEDARMRRVYGLSHLQYLQLLEAQNNKCRTCKTENPDTTKTGQAKKWTIDHCHSTNKVRGLLCRRCNLALGCLQDSPEILRAAANYLRKYSTGDDTHTS